MISNLKRMHENAKQIEFLMIKQILHTEQAPSAAALWNPPAQDSGVALTSRLHEPADMTGTRSGLGVSWGYGHTDMFK